DPYWSTIAFAILIGLGVTASQRRFTLSVDSIIGVFFSGVVAFGLAAASRDRAVARHAQSFLYGDILTLGDTEIRLMLAALAVVVAFNLLGNNRLVYIGLNPVLARTHGVRTGVFQYLFSALLALTAIFAVWTVGVFLVTAMLVVPAAAARNVARSAGGMFWYALAVSVISAVAGLLISAQPWAGTATGPTIILVSMGLFILSGLVSWIRKRTGT
ncbi:MAG: metal ABC transporter permease, partial [Planctomycetes bacterium]|nr:metal ABC transporter permease [Planctomycetota bacterium]